MRREAVAPPSGAGGDTGDVPSRANSPPGAFLDDGGFRSPGNDNEGGALSLNHCRGQRTGLRDKIRPRTRLVTLRVQV